MSKANLLIVQGGGPTPVFNASLASVVAEALAQPQIGSVYGSLFGMQGLSLGDTVELGQLTREDLAMIRNSPGAALGSSRFTPTKEDLERCVDHLRRLKIRHMIFMGGNGTMRGADLFLQDCRTVGYDIQIVG